MFCNSMRINILKQIVILMRIFFSSSTHFKTNMCIKNVKNKHKTICFIIYFCFKFTLFLKHCKHKHSTSFRKNTKRFQKHNKK